jgi:hypothetical protein
VFYNQNSSTLVAARYKAWGWGRSLAGIESSNSAESMEVSLLQVLCTVSRRSLRRADHLSSGVVPSVMVQPRPGGDQGSLEAVKKSGGSSFFIVQVHLVV